MLIIINLNYKNTEENLLIDMLIIDVKKKCMVNSLN